MLGGAQPDVPVPRVTPAVDAYWAQHIHDTGEEPTGGGGPARSGSAGRAGSAMTGAKQARVGASASSPAGSSSGSPRAASSAAASSAAGSSAAASSAAGSAGSGNPGEVTAATRAKVSGRGSARLPVVLALTRPGYLPPLVLADSADARIPLRLGTP
jgi:hypothetical protein